MDVWHIWVIVALLFIIVEIFTVGFAVICLSIGCFGAAVAAAAGLSLEMQFLLFAVVSLLSLVSVRPLLKRLLFNRGEKVLTNADAIIGRRGVVCVDIASGGEGRVMVDGVDWKAQGIDNEALKVGDKVEIVAIDSILLTVKKL